MKLARIDLRRQLRAGCFQAKAAKAAKADKMLMMVVVEDGQKGSLGATWPSLATEGLSPVERPPPRHPLETVQTEGFMLRGAPTKLQHSKRANAVKFYVHTHLKNTQFTLCKQNTKKKYTLRLNQHKLTCHETIYRQTETQAPISKHIKEERKKKLAQT